MDVPPDSPAEDPRPLAEAGLHVVIVGSFTKGYRVVGPFDCFESALAWYEKSPDWAYITQLHNPDTFEEN